MEQSLANKHKLSENLITAIGCRLFILSLKSWRCLRTIQVPFAKGEEKNTAEVELCQNEDLVVAVGPKLKEAFSCKLRLYHQDIFQLIPGSFAEFSDIKHAAHDGVNFRVLSFGRGDLEDFSLKGYDIAAKSIVELKDSSYILIFVGASKGRQDEVAENLLQTGISSHSG